MLFAPAATAEGISVNMVEIHLTDDGYQLSTNYDIKLNPAVREALSRGVPIYFISEFSLTRPRWEWLDSAQRAVSDYIQGYFVDKPTPSHWSWLDEEIYQGKQTIKLSYNVLTGRYRISRGALYQNFASLNDALNILARQNSGTVASDLIKGDVNYLASARLYLDISQLPKPLQVSALTDSDWTFDSDWYHWMLNPGEIAPPNNPETE